MEFSIMADYVDQGKLTKTQAEKQQQLRQSGFPVVVGDSALKLCSSAELLQSTFD